jgi:hypothetical protein
MNKEFKIKFHNQGLKLSKGDDEYEVRTKGGNEVTVRFNKDKVEKGDKSEKVELEYKKKDEKE